MSDRMARWPAWMKEPYRTRRRQGAGAGWLWVLAFGASLASLAWVARRLWLLP